MKLPNNFKVNEHDVPTYEERLLIIVQNLGMSDFAMEEHYCLACYNWASPMIFQGFLTIGAIWLSMAKCMKFTTTK